MVDLGFIHRFEAGTSGRTLLLLHGTGGDEHDLIPLGRTLDPAAAVLSPRGQVTENGAPRFFRRLAMGVFDVDDLMRRTHDLADFVERAASHYGFDLASMVALGYSNGANIAASALLLRPGLIRAAALLHAMVPFEPEEVPDLRGTRVFLSGGRRDPLIPPAGTERLGELLVQAGAEVYVAWQPGGHELTHVELDAVRGWLRRMEAGAEVGGE